MILKDLDLVDGNHFVAMEYYWLMLNRTYLILLLEDCLVGIKANGIVSIETGTDSFSRKVTKSLAIHGDLRNPYSYIKNKYIKKSESADLQSSEILSTSKSNFRMAYKDIKKVWYDPRRKWGMGYYPHDGKVYITTLDNKTREFIILGHQSGELIKDWIAEKLEIA